MSLFVAPNGAVTIRLQSEADLTGWSVRLAILSGMAVEFQEELVADEASFVVPPSLIGRRYELSAIGPDLDLQEVASGTIAVDTTPEVNVYAFEPRVIGDPFETYVHDQLAPATQWTIEHDLGREPSVQIVDSAGTQVYGDVTHVDLNTVQLDFSAPFGGRAILGG